MAVARAVRSTTHLRLAGVEAFEGALVADASDDALAVLDELLAAVRDVVDAVGREGLFDVDEVIVTAGGSMYFDRVVATLADWPNTATNVTLVAAAATYPMTEGNTNASHRSLSGGRPARSYAS